MAEREVKNYQTEIGTLNYHAGNLKSRLDCTLHENDSKEARIQYLLTENSGLRAKIEELLNDVNTMRTILHDRTSQICQLDTINMSQGSAAMHLRARVDVFSLF